MQVRGKQMAGVRMAVSQILLVGAVGGLSAAAHGQEAANRAATPTMLDTVIVSAGRTEEPISSIPGSVIVIGREEIERQLQLTSNPSKVLQKLVPGYSVSNETLSNASENFRGRNTLILVDGVQRNTPLRDISRMLSGIDLNDIERIEVVNGASAIYGNGATGGVVNFITKSGAGKREVTASAGLRAFTANVGDSIAPEFSGGFRGDVGPVDVMTNLTAKYTRDVFDGHGTRVPSDAMLGQGGADNISDYNGMLKVGKTFDARRLEFSFNAVHLDQDPDYYTNYATRPVSVAYNAPYEGKSVAERSEFYRSTYSDGDFALGTLRVDVSYSDIERRAALAPLSVANSLVYYTSGPFTRLNTDGQTTLYSQQLALQTAVTTPLDVIKQGMKFTWGGDLGRDETEQKFQDGVNAIAPMEQVNMAAYGQVDVPVVEAFRLRGGMRYERFDLDISNFRRPSYTNGAGAVAAANVIGGSFKYDAVVYNGGFVLDIAKGAELFGGISQGYSLPDYGGFTRRAGTSGISTNFSTLSPQPQKVTTYEIGTRGEIGNGRGGVSGYLSKSDLGTVFIPATNAISQQKERVYGLEAYGEYGITDALTLGGTWAWMEGQYDQNRDGSIDNYLPNNRIGAPMKATLYAEWEVARDWSLRGESVYFSSRNRGDGTTRYKLDDGVFLNAVAAYRLGQGTFSFGVENILDTFELNPTASATRNAPIAAYGRTVAARYSHKF